MKDSVSNSGKKLIAIHARVTGLVQGVFFRASTQKTADKLHLKGWVKNIANGDVEVVAHGEDASIEAFTDFLKSGPPAARVDHLEIKKIDYCDKYTKFEVL